MAVPGIEEKDLAKIPFFPQADPNAPILDFNIAFEKMIKGTFIKLS